MFGLGTRRDMAAMAPVKDTELTRKAEYGKVKDSLARSNRLARRESLHNDSFKLAGSEAGAAPPRAMSMSMSRSFPGAAGRTLRLAARLSANPRMVTRAP